MSIYASLRAGVSGLYTQAQAMGMISDNIANVNTVGYKRVTARFSNFVINQDNQAFYTPGGASIKSVRENAEQGLLINSQSPADLAMSGDGFFIVTDDVTRNSVTGEWEPTGETFYTRSGQFRPDRHGNLKNAEGFYLLAWPRTATQVAQDVTFDETNRVSSLEAVNISAADFSPEETTYARIGANLNSDQSIFPLPPVGTPIPPGAKHWEMSIPVNDKQGNVDNVVLRFIKTAERVWEVHVQTSDFALLTGASINYNTRDITGGTIDPTDPQGLVTRRLFAELTFDATGKLEQVTRVPAGPGGLAQPRTPDATGDSSLDGVLTLFLDSDNDVAGPTTDDRIAIDFDFGTIGRGDGFSHYRADNSAKVIDQNGKAYSFLSGVSFATDGRLSALFANGESREIYKVPVATFASPVGLRSRTGNVFTQTVQSGQALFKTGGSGGAGKVIGSTIEQSTSDIANEFSDMIIVQRAYAANTRVVSTSDQMLEELLRAKR